MSSIVDSPSLTGTPAHAVVQAIKTAAARTGADFAYLLQTSGIESSFAPNAHARAHASSATGLFQFTKQTWLGMVKSHGAAHGLANYANQIQIGANGVAHVSDPAARQAILDLRKDPQIAAEMAAELGKANRAILQRKVGGKIGPTELYLAHFLGAGGATSLLKAKRANPDASASDVLPAAARANRAIFFAANGQPRSVGQIYSHFATKFEPRSPNPAMHSSAPLLATASEPALPLSSVSGNAAASYIATTLPLAGIVAPNDGGNFTANRLGKRMAELTSALALQDDEDVSAISVQA